MTLTDSPTLSDSSSPPLDPDELADEVPPQDPAELQAWLDVRIDRLAAAMNREMHRLIREAGWILRQSLTAAADFSGIDNLGAQWTDFVQTSVGPYMGTLYRQGALTAWLGAKGTKGGGKIPPSVRTNFARVVNTDAVTYAAQASNRIVGASDGLWSQMRSSLSYSLADGETTEQVKDRIEKLTGYSEFRSDTIARTEVVGAFVQGDHSAAVSLGDYGPVEHYWIATLDVRTRETHAEANEQCVPFDQPFDVGGVAMSAPHDPSAPPEEVVNCRCVEGHLYYGDERPDGTTIDPPPDAEPEEWTPDPYDGPPLTLADDQPNLGGIHQKMVLSDGQGNDYLFKPQEATYAHAESAASEIARLSGIDVPRVTVYEHNGQVGSLQQMLPGARPGFKGSIREWDPLRVGRNDLEQIQRHRALDWAIGNHDAHAGQWVRQGYATAGDPVIGVDKGQAFKFWQKDRLAADYAPNEFQPVYNLVEDAYRRGESIAEDLFALDGPTLRTVDRLSAIPDGDYRALLQRYADGRYGKGSAEGRQFLDAMVKRKNDLRSDFTAHYHKLTVERGKALKAQSKLYGVGDGAPKGMTGVIPSEDSISFMADHDHPLTSRDKHISDYTGSGYRYINEQLRAGAANGKEDAIAGVAAQLKPVKKDIEVYRGTRLSNYLPDGHSFEDVQGGVFNDRAFLSTSAGHKQGPGYGSTEVGLRIRVNKGFKGAYVDPVSANAGEREFLLDKDQLLYVHKVRAPNPDVPWETRYDTIMEVETVSKEWAAKKGIKVWDTTAKAFK